MSDVTFDIQNNSMLVHKERAEQWKVTLVETGLESMTGGRIKRVESYLDDGEDFLMTYGDGLANIDIDKLIESHKESKSLATVSACNPPARFGSLKISDGKVINFDEKPAVGERIINGGYFILSKKVLKYISDDTTVWEQEPVKNLVKDNELNSYIHHDFFQPMDTLRDKKYLESLWRNSKAPWKNW
jgi:glucose-1-phosphate cytidylyltransferase